MIEVYLNKIKKCDANKIVEWKSDKELSEMILSNPVYISTSEAEKWIEKNSNDNNQKLFGIYINKKDNYSEIVGITRLMFIDFESGVAELGTYIGSKDYRGKGIGAISLIKILEYAFNELLLNKIFMKVAEDNIASIQLHLKHDFVVEGKLKEHFIRNDSFEGNNLLIMSRFKN